jgi:hypothetical protein
LRDSAPPPRHDAGDREGYRAVQQGFVKHIKGLVLNPASLRYVRRDDGREVEVDLDEDRPRGEIDAGFRRSIVVGHGAVELPMRRAGLLGLLGGCTPGDGFDQILIRPVPPLRTPGPRKTR